MNLFLRASFAVGFAGLVFSAFPVIGDQPASAQSSQNPWTAWLDRDDPSLKGDYETVKNFLEDGLIEPNPVAIQCRTVAAPGAPSVNWNAPNAPKQVYSCTAERGGVCVNAEQKNGEQCLDYEVRFRYKDEEEMVKVKKHKLEKDKEK